MPVLVGNEQRDNRVFMVKSLQYGSVPGSTSKRCSLGFDASRRIKCSFATLPCRISKQVSNPQRHATLIPPNRVLSPSPSIIVKPSQLLPRILDILLGLHTHVIDRTILTTANNLAMQTPLTSLTLRPQPPKPNLQLTDLRQRLRVQFPNPRSAILAHGTRHLGLRAQGLLAAHARLGLLCEFHQTAGRGGSDGDGARVFACEELTGFLFAEDRFEDATQGFGELVVKIVFGVDGEVVLEDVDGVFGALVVLCTSRAFDYHVGDTIA